MKVTIDDIRKAGYCAAGARRWFAAHGIPFAPFLKDGIDADELIARGDGLAETVVARKREREAGGGNG